MSSICPVRLIGEVNHKTSKIWFLEGEMSDPDDDVELVGSEEHDEEDASAPCEFCQDHGRGKGRKSARLGSSSQETD